MPPSPGRIRPIPRRDVLVAALVRRSLKRILDVFLADGRRVAATRTLDESLQVGAPGFVERNGHAAPPLANRGRTSRADEGGDCGSSCGTAKRLSVRLMRSTGSVRCAESP